MTSDPSRTFLGCLMEEWLFFFSGITTANTYLNTRLWLHWLVPFCIYLVISNNSNTSCINYDRMIYTDSFRYSMLSVTRVPSFFVSTLSLLLYNLCKGELQVYREFTMVFMYCVHPHWIKLLLTYLITRLDLRWKEKLKPSILNSIATLETLWTCLLQ